MSRFLTLCFTLALAALALGSVVELTDENFAETTKEGFWLIKFFAPWCGHCKKLAPTWDHLGKELAGKANIAKVDCTEHKETCGKFEVRGYPTIKLIEAGEEKEKYAGPRTAGGFVSFLQDKAGLPSDVKVAELEGTKQEKPKNPNAEEAPSGPTAVVTLTADNFADTIKEGSWFIKFYAPWCGHCKKLAPTWDHLSVELKGKANIAKVDCTAHSGICSEHGVRGYPTLKLFKDGEAQEKYSGGRDVKAFEKYLKDEKVIGSDVSVKPLAGQKPNNAAKKNEPAAPPKEEGPTDVVVLTDEDFAEKTKEGSWLIKFYAPWCGHCKKLAPAWNELGTKVNLNSANKVKVAKVDCTSQKSSCQANGVKGYPTLKLFTDGEEVESYRGKRDLDALTQFLDQKELLVEAGAKHSEL